MTDRIGGYIPPRLIDPERVKKAMEEYAAVRDAHELGEREGFARGLQQKPLRERRERIATAVGSKRTAAQALAWADELITLLDGEP